MPDVSLTGRSWLSGCSRPYNVSRGSIMQCIKLYSIVSPCQCIGRPSSAVILIAADPGNVELDNHGSDDWKRKGGGRKVRAET